MKQGTVVAHEFVEFIPEELQGGTLYISMAYSTVAHACFCGCGKKVVTPLSPTDWNLIYDGRSITLNPSIGNWNLECSSHYWIRRSKVIWAPQWSQEEIDAGRLHDRLEKKRYYKSATPRDTHNVNSNKKSQLSLWQKLKKWF